jgi:uncharacterized membrane protein
LIGFIGVISTVPLTAWVTQLRVRKNSGSLWGLTELRH